MGTENTLLSQSLYCCLVLNNIYCEFISEKLSRFFSPTAIAWIEIISTVVSTVMTKSYIMKSEDDNHIFDLLQSKFTNFKNFHTMLYTCAPEFDFLQYETYRVIILTALLPTVILAGLFILYYWYRNYQKEGYPDCIEPDVAYNILQCGAFTIMAVLIMRLKLFMTPHLCIIAGLVAGKRYLGKFGIRGEASRGALITLILALMTYNGIQILEEERSHVGTFLLMTGFEIELMQKIRYVKIIRQL